MALIASTTVLAAVADNGALPPISLRYSEHLTLTPIGSDANSNLVDVMPPPAEIHRPKRKQALTITGSLAGWSSTRRDDDSDWVAVPKIGVEANVGLPAGFSTAVLVDATREQAHPAADSRTQVTLREAWIGWKDGLTSARVGWQIVNWGRTDVLNPTDNVSARDYTRLVDRDVDEKLGVPMVEIQRRFGGTVNVQALWEPVYRSSKVPLPPYPGAHYVETLPNIALGSGGIRVNSNGERFSGSVSYFRGPAKLPNLALSPTDVASGVLGLNHPTTDVLGVDGEAVLGQWVVRGESAWTRVRGSGSDPIASQESAIDTVFGIERSFGQASAFLQGEWKQIPGWIDLESVEGNLKPLAQANASFDDELHRSRRQIGGGFALNTSDLRWSVSFDSAWVPGDGDWVFRPRMRWRFDDRLLLFGGGDWYRGPTLGVYGRLHQSSTFFAGVSSSISMGRHW